MKRNEERRRERGVLGERGIKGKGGERKRERGGGRGDRQRHRQTDRQAQTEKGR